MSLWQGNSSVPTSLYAEPLCYIPVVLTWASAILCVPHSAFTTQENGQRIHDYRKKNEAYKEEKIQTLLTLGAVSFSDKISLNMHLDFIKLIRTRSRYKDILANVRATNLSPGYYPIYTPRNPHVNNVWHEICTLNEYRWANTTFDCCTWSVRQHAIKFHKGLSTGLIHKGLALPRKSWGFHSQFPVLHLKSMTKNNS